MSGIIVDRAILYLQTQPAGILPGDVLVFLILEIAASGFKVRVKSGKLKSINPPLMEGKSTEETHIFQVEEDAKRDFRERVELLTQIGYRSSLARTA